MSDADTTAWIVREGQDVLGSDGKKVGEVTGSAGSALVVKHGFLFTAKEIFVPVSAIAGIDPHAVHLNVPADTAMDEAWTSPPADAVRVPNVGAEAPAAPAEAEAGESWTIAEGMAVIGADGEQIGTVEDGNAETLSVRVGRFFSKVVTITAAQITDVRGDTVHVSATKAALGQGTSSSATPLTDLQGRITNAWGGSKAELDAGVPDVDYGKPDPEFPITPPAGEPPYTPPVVLATATAVPSTATDRGSDAPDMTIDTPAVAAEVPGLDLTHAGIPAASDGGVAALPGEEQASAEAAPFSDADVVSALSDAGAIGESPDPALAEAAREVAREDALAGAGYPDLPSDPHEGDGDRPEDPASLHLTTSDDADIHGITLASAAPPVDLPGDRAPDDPEATPPVTQAPPVQATAHLGPDQTPDARGGVAEPEKAGLFGQLRSRINTFFDKPAETTGTPPSTAELAGAATAATTAGNNQNLPLADAPGAAVPDVEVNATVPDVSPVPEPPTDEESAAPDSQAGDPGVVLAETGDARDVLSDEERASVGAEDAPIVDEPMTTQPDDLDAEAFAQELYVSDPDINGMVRTVDPADWEGDASPDEAPDDGSPEHHDFVTDLRAKVEHFLDNPDAARLATDEKASASEAGQEGPETTTSGFQRAPTAESASAAAFDEPADTTEVLSRFAVVRGHDDDDDLLDTLRDGAGDKTAQAAGSEAGLLASDVSIEGASPQFEALAGDAATDGGIDYEVNEAASEILLPESQLPAEDDGAEHGEQAETDVFAAIVDATQENDIDGFGTPDEHQADTPETAETADGPEEGGNAPEAGAGTADVVSDLSWEREEPEETFTPTPDDELLASLPTPQDAGSGAGSDSNAQGEETAPPSQPAGQDDLAGPDAAGDAEPSGSTAVSGDTDDDSDAAPLAGDTTIAENAVTGDLAGASDAASDATRQDSTIAGNALTGSLSGASDLARGWAGAERAATADNAQATLDGKPAVVPGATPLATTSASPGQAPEDEPPSPARAGKLVGPVDTEGTDWIAAVAGEDAPNGWTVKGNADSGIYHTLESSSYERTRAEVWFPDAAAAERSGYRAPQSAHHAGTRAAAAVQDAAASALAAVPTDEDTASGASTARDSSAGSAKGMGPAETEGIDWIRADQAGAEHADWLVKGNAGSGIFHTPESPSYERTIAEVWFPNAEAAERSGYRAPRSAHHAGSSAAAGAKNAAIEATDAAKADDEA